jgi:hypothetical protein
VGSGSEVLSAFAATVATRARTSPLLSPVTYPSSRLAGPIVPRLREGPSDLLPTWRGSKAFVQVDGYASPARQ